jgi:hypothetical protein
MTPSPAPLAWGQGDTYTLTLALVIFAVACVIHRKAIAVRGLDCGDTLVGLMSGALSIGPLLMIVFDPLFKNISYTQSIDLLQIILSESRITLWFAAFLALINAVIGLLRSRYPRPGVPLSILGSP